MNIINDMVSNLNQRKKRPTATKNMRAISCLISSSIMLPIGISFLAYSIWFYNFQPDNALTGNESIAKAIKFKKNDLNSLSINSKITDLSDTAPTIDIKEKERQAPKVQKATSKENASDHSLKKKESQFSNVQSAKNYYTSALTQLSAGNITSATKMLNKVLIFSPEHIDARKTLAGIYIKEDQLKKAKKILKEGIKQTPDASIFYHWLAHIHMEQQQFTKASALLLTGSEYAKSGEYYALMALAQQNTPSFKNAISSYRQALSYKPTESKWWLGLGIVLEKSNNWKEAQEAYLVSLKAENLPFFLHNQANKRLAFIKDQLALALIN